MKTLPNGLKVFNATPHSITFFDGVSLIEVESDKVINASVEEKLAYVNKLGADEAHADEVIFVRTEFVGTQEGREIVRQAIIEQGADVVVGSIIAAQAYPGDVVAMVPYPGFERVSPAEKRMRIDKFTTFSTNWSFPKNQ